MMPTRTVPFKPAALATNLVFAAETGDALRLSRELAHTRTVLNRTIRPATASHQAEMLDLLDALADGLSAALDTRKTGSWNVEGFPMYLLRHVAGPVH